MFNLTPQQRHDLQLILDAAEAIRRLEHHDKATTFHGNQMVDHSVPSGQWQVPRHSQGYAPIPEQWQGPTDGAR